MVLMLRDVFERLGITRAPDPRVVVRDRDDTSPARTVLLRHTLAGGTPHFDWLFEAAYPAVGTTSNDDAPTLDGFRLAVDPAIASAFNADPHGFPHRRRYLWYEGELSGGRGTVRRVWSGVARDAGDAFVLALDDGRLVTLRLEAAGGESPRFLRVSRTTQAAPVPPDASRRR